MQALVDGAPVPLRVGVVGGGWAGIAAAVESVARGHRVTLIEMAPAVGGRARSVSIGDSLLDNGQHILIGAYRDCLRLMRQVGVDPDAALLRLPLRLVYPEGTGLRLRSGAPAWAFARAVCGASAWEPASRLALLATAAGWVASGFRCDPGSTVAALTARLPLSIRAELIDPLCVAALNTPADAASGRVFLRVLRDALFSGPGSADLLLPRTDLGRLLPGPAADWLVRAGATVLLGRRAERIGRSADGGWQVDVGGRDHPATIPVDHLILASPARESARLVRPFAPEWSAAAEALVHEPIVTVYLSIPGARLPEPMLALREDATSPAQFVFDRGQLGGPAGLLAFVVSGAAGWVERGTPAIEAAVVAQARRLVGAAPAIGRAVTLTEKRATFRCTPDLVRPDMRIAGGLTAAGDHVDGPYPATLEGAVRSGRAAAATIPALDRLSAGRTAPPAARR